MAKKLGPDTGYDCADSTSDIRSMGALLDTLNREGNLPKVILYPLNASDMEPYAILAAAFCKGPARGTVQLGAPWWFSDQAHGIRKAQRPGTDQRRVLTQAVPRHPGRQNPGGRTPHTPGCNPRRQHGRLRVLGGVEAFRRAIFHHAPDIIAQHGRSLAKHRLDFRMLFGQLGQHAHRLRTLARKDKGQARIDSTHQGNLTGNQ